MIRDFLAFLKKTTPRHFTAFFFKKLSRLISYQDLLTHAYIPAKTRSGKSELIKLIFLWLLRKSGRKTSFVIIDPHGDLAEEIRNLSEVADSGRLVYINPTLQEGYTPTLNPFLMKSGTEKDIINTTSHLLKTFEELVQERGLSGSMRTLLRPCIEAILQDEDPSLKKTTGCTS